MERFLTARWNNRIAFSLGLVTLTYVMVALAASLWFGQEGFIGLVIIGSAF